MYGLWCVEVIKNKKNHHKKVPLILFYSFSHPQIELNRISEVEKRHALHQQISQKQKGTVQRAGTLSQPCFSPLSQLLYFGWNKIAALPLSALFWFQQNNSAGRFEGAGRWIFKKEKPQGRNLTGWRIKLESFIWRTVTFSSVGITYPSLLR